MSTESAVSAVSRFVDECCLVSPNARYPAVNLYLAYVLWSLGAGLPVQDQFTFVDLLGGHGLKYRRRDGYVRGIAVLPRHRCDVADSPG